MKHFEEHSLEDILNLSPEGYAHPAVVDGKLVGCEETRCIDCEFSYRHTRSDRPCALHFIEWLYSEVSEDTSEVDVAPGDVQEKGKVNVMEDYKLRMINEYKELEEKYNKLHKMLVKYDAGKLDFMPTCPIDLLRKQASFMGQYLYILETRAVIEGIDLNAEKEDDNE